MYKKMLAVLPMLWVAGFAAAESYLFTNGNLLTMSGDGLVGGEVLVQGERIVAVGEISGVSEENLHVIDMAGGYLMPGLAEMHAHVPRPDRDQAYMEDVLFLWAAHGITTVRGMLGHATHLTLREDIRTHRIFGPRLITSGPSFNGSSVSSPEQASHMVREQQAAGFDFLKIHPGLTLAEYTAVAKTARELGMPFAGHVPVDVGLIRALEQGQISIDHTDGFVHALVPNLTPTTPGFGSGFGVGLIDQVDLSRLPSLVDATWKTGTWIVPTETLLENFAGDLDELLRRPEVRFIPPELLARYERAISQRENDDAAARLLELRKVITLALHEGGVELLLGSDSPQVFNVPGFSIHRELQSMVAAGLSPFEAIAIGTMSPARFFGMDDEFGRIAPSLAADLVLLGSDPLKDIRNTSDIRGVMVRGKWLDAKERQARLTDIVQRYVE